MRVSISKHHKTTNEQKVAVRIDPWDTYCCPTTIARIALPLLKEFRVQRKKVPGVPTAFLPDDYDGSIESLNKGEERFLDIIGRMEWSFEQILNDSPDVYNRGAEAIKEHDKKVQEGLDLFGKYFTTLWW